jgi:membrane protein implicated in regulation of membrane protease activity
MISHRRLQGAGGALDGGRSPGAARITLAGLSGALATIAALAIGSVLALVFAATLAVVAVLAVLLLALAALAWRFRQPALRRGPQTGGDAPVIEAHKVGHSWVAYGWDQPS